MINASIINKRPKIIRLMDTFKNLFPPKEEKQQTAEEQIKILRSMK